MLNKAALGGVALTCALLRARGYPHTRYELAYHDWTQIDFCGCTRFNMTRSANQIKDAFTTKCPYQFDEAETFVINMREEVNDATPGSFVEHAFYNTWRNKVGSRACLAFQYRISLPRAVITAA